MKQVKKYFIAIVVLLGLVVLTACTEADKVSYNVSQDADNFNVIRRVTVINTRTDKAEFEAIGRISVNTEDKNKLIVIAETSKGVYKKHLINLTGNNMYVVEDLEGAKVNQYKYEVNYMPESIIPWTVTEKK
ncbi:beta-sandwich lipoprotein [Lactococcus petauri]|uniref:beta-sandwich lipoprotein n=1 Tax=Lactococcus petauri TaxID=1940789 RepID=UPI00385337F2